MDLSHVPRGQVLGESSHQGSEQQAGPPADTRAPADSKSSNRQAGANMINEWLQTLTAVECFVFFLTANVAVLAFSVTLWHCARRWKPSAIELDPAPPVSAGDLLLTASSISMCVVVSAAGWWLASHHWLVLSHTTIVRLIVDCALIILIMDLFMYVSHRVASGLCENF